MRLAKKHNSGSKITIHRTGRKLTLIQISVQQKKISRENYLSIKEKLKVVKDNRLISKRLRQLIEGIIKEDN
jgi:hypothetical protein